MPEDVKCPLCGSDTVVRTEKKGPNAGQRSRVCLEYPVCRSKIPLAGQSDSIDVEKLQVQVFRTLWAHMMFQHNVANLVETGFRGTPYLRVGRLLEVGLSIFETGMLLGRARHDKLRLLVKIFPVDEGKEDSVIKLMQKLARERLDGFGIEPDSFGDYFMVTELAKADLSPTSKPKNLKALFMGKVPMNEVEDNIMAWGVEGIGFGSSFPELTEKLLNNYYNAYKSIDSDEWSKLRDQGLVLSERPQNITLIEREQVVLRLVADFVEVHYPELIDPLELRL